MTDISRPHTDLADMNRFFAIDEVEQPNGMQKLTLVVRLHAAIRVPPIGAAILRRSMPR
jgi:hypothetical protein